MSRSDRPENPRENQPSSADQLDQPGSAGSADATSHTASTDAAMKAAPHTPKLPANLPGETPIRPDADAGNSDVTGDLADLPFSPLCADPEAFRLMVEQTRAPLVGETGRAKQLDTDAGLLAATVAVASHAMPTIELADVEADLDELAQNVRESMPIPADSDRQPSPQALLAHLHQTIFDDYGFRGNGTDYYNPRNSFLPSVLKTRRGLPISLALVYKLVAGRVGIKCWGVGLPGHFVAGVDCHGPMLVDCFHGGRTLDRDDAEDRVKACCGEEADFREDMLRPVTHRHWVTRLIQNLLQTYTTAGQYSDVAAMLEFELVLWPDQLHLERDLGLVLARLGQTAAATTWINRYLEQRPDDPQRPDLEELLGVLS